MQPRTRRTAEPERPVSLLTGEDPDTDRAEDARRWIVIYGELLAFNTEILSRIQGSAVPPAKRDLGVDGCQAERELDRLRARLDFWQSRHRQLAAIDFDEKQGLLHGSRGPVALTVRECQLLSFLLHRPNRYYPPATLAALAWHDPRLAPEQVRSYVVRLRRRIEEAGTVCWIESRRGRGYRLSFTTLSPG